MSKRYAARKAPMSQPYMHRLPTTVARKHLSEIVTRVQDPRSFCVLTRHGKALAAIVPMSSLQRIFDLEEIEHVPQHGHRPSKFHFDTGDWATNQEAAEAILKIQLDRKTEREVLARAGLDPIPGGELITDFEVQAPAPRRGWLRRVLRR